MSTVDKVVRLLYSKSGSANPQINVSAFIDWLTYLNVSVRLQTVLGLKLKSAIKLAFDLIELENHHQNPKKNYLSLMNYLKK